MEGPRFNYRRQIHNLWRYKGVLILVTLVAAVTAFVTTSMRPPLYEATAKLMAGNSQQKLTAIPSGIPGGLELTYLQDVGNQIEVIKSHAVLEEAVARLEPEKAADPAILQIEVNKLEAALTVQQVGTTDLVTITVVSTSPGLAQEQANAVAQAYIDQVQSLTTTTIENALEDTTNRLAELQKSTLDLSLSPVLPRLTARINAALPALRAASEDLRQIEQMDIQAKGSLLSPGNGTAQLQAQINSINQRIDGDSSEAADLETLVQALDPVSLKQDYSKRSSSIAIIESRTRALVTKLDGLSSEITTTAQAETDPSLQERWSSLEEQLQVAGAIGTAVLDQVESLYDIQGQYLAASSSAEPAQPLAQAVEADANALNRITKHVSILVQTLNDASDQAAQINPPPPVNTMQWRYEALAGQADSAATTLQGILQKLQPGASGGETLVTRSDLSAMEIQSRTVTIGLDSMSSELTGLQSAEPEPEVASRLIGIQESVSIAGNAAGGLGDDIADITDNGGDTGSYLALDNLRQQLQLALMSSDTEGTRVVDTAVVSQAGNFFARYRGVFLAAIAGLFLSALGVMLSQGFDLTVRDSSQAEGQLGLPLMASIALSRNGNNRFSSLEEAPAEYLEPLRLLRTSLNLDSAKGKILLVTSAQAREGKTMVAADLARAVALMGRKILLIDGNLHYPGIGAVFGLPEETKGLSDFLMHGEDMNDYIARDGDLSILSSGVPSPFSAELFSSPRLKTMLERARQDFDVIIIDSASIKEWTDTRILAKDVDSVLMVVQNGVSKLDLADESKRALEAAGAHVEGFVLLAR